MIGQIERLEQVTPSQDAASAPIAVASDWREERRRWEAERDREVERLRSEAARLMDAWRELESEQRKLLLQSGNHASGATPRPRANSPLDPDDRRSMPDCYADSERPEPIDDNMLSAEVAALQFQQMRREMQRHRNRR